jgi:hypothetical protein
MVNQDSKTNKYKNRQISLVNNLLFVLINWIENN